MSVILNYNILIVDDEDDYREMFALILEEKGYNSYKATSVKEAKEIIKNNKIDMVITDLIMKNETGLELLHWVKNYNMEIGIIMVTAYGTVETAVQAIQEGAYNYFIKSNDPSTLLLDIERFLQLKELQIENNLLKNQNKEISMLESNNLNMRNIISICNKIANSNLSVLILGESGVGKEVIARYIHEKSERNLSPFVPVNCQEYSEGILESELFGHEKGAFTGAIKQKIGKFEEASHGTLFLDEIADISLNTQVKLLRILEDKSITRVGGNKKINIDVRLISATNQNIDEYIKNGTLREDFLYRINGIILNIPPLRERPEDIEKFTNSDIAIPETEEHKRFIERLTKEAVIVSINRHAGGYRTYFGSKSDTLAFGKDLTAVKWIVGTGGALTRLTAREEILNSISQFNRADKLLPTAEAKILIDNDYIMASLGVLSSLNKEAAIKLLLKSLKFNENTV